MPVLPDFNLETYFSKWEFTARYHMTASDAESMSVEDLLQLGTDKQREDFYKLWLGYTPTFGDPELRQDIADLYSGLNLKDILCFAGAGMIMRLLSRRIINRQKRSRLVSAK